MIGNSSTDSDSPHPFVACVGCKRRGYPTLFRKGHRVLHLVELYTPNFPSSHRSHLPSAARGVGQS